jgi:hypothetical protein
MTTNNADDPDFHVPTVPTTEMSTDDPRNVTGDDLPPVPETGEPRGGDGADVRGQRGS